MTSAQGIEIEAARRRTFGREPLLAPTRRSRPPRPDPRTHPRQLTHRAWTIDHGRRADLPHLPHRRTPHRCHRRRRHPHHLQPLRPHLGPRHQPPLRHLWQPRRPGHQRTRDRESPASSLCGPTTHPTSITSRPSRRSSHPARRTSSPSRTRTPAAKAPPLCTSPSLAEGTRSTGPEGGATVYRQGAPVDVLTRLPARAPLGVVAAWPARSGLRYRSRTRGRSSWRGRFRVLGRLRALVRRGVR
jgi:hypothetical protein